MYVKLFRSIFQGTLRGNSSGLLVFTNLLANCDRDGVVDMHPKAIAEEVGLDMETVRAVLIDLEAPDAESRSPDEDGRRIVRIDGHRAWGWRVVNYGKYRSIKNEEDRREANRIAVAKHRAKASKASLPVITCNQKSSLSAQAEAEAEEERNIVPAGLVVRDDAYRPPDCPFADLKAAYHDICQSLPRMRIDTNMRLKHCRARWIQVCVAEKWDRDAGLEWFRWFFAEVEKSDFLTGRRGNKDRPWTADFQWLMTAGNFAKVVEGKYAKETT
jgi:hypothetical protein